MKLNHSQFFSLLRSLLGLWLLQHFIFLLPYTVELHGLSGLKVAGGEIYLKDFLFYLRSDFGIYFLNILAVLFSILFVFKIYRRLSSLILFIIWIFFYHQNFISYTPILPYVGWLLLAFTLIDSSEVRFFYQKNDSTFEYSPLLFHGFWLITALSYTASGFQKFLYSPLWHDGRALDFVMNYPAARNHWLNEQFLMLPLPLRMMANYLIIFIEGGYVFSFFHSQLRKIFWIGILIMHFSILICIKFSELSIGMIIVHLFLVEDDWFKLGGLSKIKWKQNWLNLN